LTEGQDDKLKYVGCALMIPLVCFMCKYFSMDPIDEGIIINEQEIILKSFLPNFSSK